LSPAKKTVKTDALVTISVRAAKKAYAIPYSAPAHTVYNPVAYARAPHEAYLRRFGKEEGRVFLMGMNPGPWGMAQTGVPFGDVGMVRDWMGIRGPVSVPKGEHPRVPVKGFDSHRKEGSGRRLWGWASEKGDAAWFFSRFFVWNYSPLCFLSEKGTNVTPDKLKREEREAMTDVCNDALRKVVDVLRPKALVGIGNYAEKRIKEVLGEDVAPVHRLLHPSPANPRANAGWVAEAESVLGQWLG